ncbi:G-patch domain and KOW motifs-containing protein isoform X2 [Lepisosteus oculatus]|uniref:G-patch domain and KOW motifs-containing protein n=1 Tax=Lepisosteus oculatus TaxID=7918 RepID=W5NC39_LEPOC|nr:PREDICTED: G patch domain and KOW motifs-containing protein isoform X2 [Lepisosteus oculatus]
MADPDKLRSDAGEKHGEVGNGSKKREAAAGPVSFGFSKTVSKFRVQSSAEKVEEKDYLTGVEGKELKSTRPAEKPKELVIPLIHKNRWYKGEGASRTASETCPQPPREEDAVESQAVKELIEESQRQQELWKNGGAADLNLSIPLLMQNKAPEGYEDGDKIQVDLRPESSTEADYDNVPVEAYGMAMLKGMGWKQGQGIGRTFKQDVKPIEHQLRPKGLGLGADRSAISDLDPSRPTRPPKPGEERADEEPRELVTGACVLVETGPHKDLYGKVEGVDPDNARVMVKLAIGGKTVTISQYSLHLVGRKEYDKYSRDLSRLGKAHKEKERAEEAARRSNGQDGAEGRGTDRESREPEARAGREHDRGKDREKEQRKRKHRDSSRDREKPHPPPPGALSWLQRDLRVRFIDKKFKEGKYYNSKMIIEDVLTPESCVCRTDEGRLLEDVKQTMLETIVPKSESDSIMVVLGKHRGQVGHILQRDKEKCRALVQLERYEEQVFKLDYDAICHYVGGTDV